jgi:hypothetical protein
MSLTFRVTGAWFWGCPGKAFMRAGSIRWPYFEVDRPDSHRLFFVGLVDWIIRGRRAGAADLDLRSVPGGRPVGFRRSRRVPRGEAAEASDGGGPGAHGGGEEEGRDRGARRRSAATGGHSRAVAAAARAVAAPGTRQKAR